MDIDRKIQMRIEALKAEAHLDAMLEYFTTDREEDLKAFDQMNKKVRQFKGPTKWVRKAIEEYKKGKKVVFVFPIDKWIHYFIEAGAEIRNLKDIKWYSIEDKQPGKGTGRWIACFVLDPRKKDRKRKIK